MNTQGRNFTDPRQYRPSLHISTRASLSYLPILGEGSGGGTVWRRPGTRNWRPWGPSYKTHPLRLHLWTRHPDKTVTYGHDTLTRQSKSAGLLPRQRKRVPSRESGQAAAASA